MDQVTQTTSISVLGFVPSLVVQYLQQISLMKSFKRTLPEKQSITSVVMFADISGFTNLTETLSKMGHEGAEVITFAINRYMELLVKGIGRSGGDIFKFAGDAMIVIWPPPALNEGHQQIRQLQTLAKSAIQSALDLQNTLNDTNVLENIKLTVKIGFGIGEVNIIHVGGVFQRTEYIATGDPLTQAFHSEHCASQGGQTIISQQVYDLVEGFFEFEQVPGKQHYFVNQVKKNYEKVRMKADALLIKNNINLSNFEKIRQAVYAYIPAALLPYMYIDQERWSSELRRLSVMFVNLGIDLSDAKSIEGLAHIQKVIETVQKCVYMHEGSVNKLLMDDKGSTLIVVFGLPPMAHQDDAIRAVLTAFSLQCQLRKINCPCAVGISTGTVFAGVVGTSGSRREYSVIGDQVNLAARLMQLACTDKEQKIIICQETADSIGHKVSSYYYQSVALKGKAGLIPIHVPLDANDNILKDMNPLNLFPSLRTHQNNFPVYANIRQTNDTTTLNQSNITQIQDVKAVSQFMVGREEDYRKIQNLLDRFMKGKENRGFVTIRGTFGSGKTLFIRKILHRIQEKLNTNQYSSWKYGERAQILVQSVGPISKSHKLCGLRQILRGVFKLFALRVNKLTSDDLFAEMVTRTSEISEAYEIFRDILGLKEIDLVSQFPAKMEGSPRKELIYQFKLIIIEFLSNYFESVPRKYQDKIKTRDFSSLEILKRDESNKSTKGNIIAPLVFIFDDMQNYDELTFIMIKQICKRFYSIICIALIRDQYAEGKLFADKNTKTSDETVIEGMASIEGVMNSNNLHSVFLRGLSRNEKDDDFLKLVRQRFGISQFVLEYPVTLINQQDTPESDEQRRRLTTYQSGYGHFSDIGMEKKQQELQNYFLFHENKQLLMAKDPTLLMTHFIYLKTQGNPLIALNFIKQLLTCKLLKIVMGKAIITQRLIDLIDTEEIILIDAPKCRVQVNGPLVDKLTCTEQLLLKVAAVVGDIFDVQTLARIQPFKNVVDNEKLTKLLEQLEEREYLEVLEIGEFNKYYRFTHPFLRECLYQRMSFAQRRQIHQSVAEAIQTMPQVYESEETRESKRLMFHWAMAETKWKLEDESTTPSQSRKRSGRKSLLFLKIKPDVSPPNSDLQKRRSNPVSFKAMRSIILKQIQNKLSRSNNDVSIVVKDGILEKKSDKNYTWASRYCQMDGKEFRYYYTEQDAQLKRDPLSSIPLKWIYSIVPLEENERYNKQYAFQMSATGWMKKSKEMGERKFYFACKDEDTLESWTIYIEFAKAKAVYDDFVNQFGKVQFPLGSSFDGYDLNMRFDQNLKKRAQFNQLAGRGGEVVKQEMKKNSIYRHSRVSSFALTHKMKFNSNTAFEEQNNALTLSITAQDPVILKERIRTFLHKSMLLFYSQLFDMAIQRIDEYRIFGQSNYAVRRLNHVFKIDKKLLEDQSVQKGSLIQNFGSLKNSITEESKQSSTEQSVKRQGVQLDTFKQMFQIEGDDLKQDNGSPKRSDTAQFGAVSKFLVKDLISIEEEDDYQKDEEDTVNRNPLLSKSKVLETPTPTDDRLSKQKEDRFSFNKKPPEAENKIISNQVTPVKKSPFGSFQSNLLQKKNFDEQITVQIQKSTTKPSESQENSKKSLDSYQNLSQNQSDEDSINKSHQSINSVQKSRYSINSGNKSRGSKLSINNQQKDDSFKQEEQKSEKFTFPNQRQQEQNQMKKQNYMKESQEINMILQTQKKPFNKEQQKQNIGDKEQSKSPIQPQKLQQDQQQNYFEQQQKQRDQYTIEMLTQQKPYQQEVQKIYKQPIKKQDERASILSSSSITKETSKLKKELEQMSFPMSYMLEQDQESDIEEEIVMKPTQKSLQTQSQLQLQQQQQQQIPPQSQIIQSIIPQASMIPPGHYIPQFLPQPIFYPINMQAQPNYFMAAPQPIQSSVYQNYINTSQNMMTQQESKSEIVAPKKKKKKKDQSKTPDKPKSSIKQDSYFGIVVKQSHSLRGDSFILKKGEKVIVSLINDNKTYIICSRGQYSGIFEKSCIQIMDEPKKDNTPTDYQILLHSSSTINRSATPNRSKSPSMVKSTTPVKNKL